MDTSVDDDEDTHTSPVSAPPPQGPVAPAPLHSTRPVIPPIAPASRGNVVIDDDDDKPQRSTHFPVIPPIATRTTQTAHQEEDDDDEVQRALLMSMQSGVPSKPTKQAQVTQQAQPRIEVSYLSTQAAQRL